MDGAMEHYFLILPTFRQRSFKVKLDFLSRPIGRERKSKQLDGTPAQVFCTQEIDVAVLCCKIPYTL